MEKALIQEREKIEAQRNEVLRLQDEYQLSREAVSKYSTSDTTVDDDQAAIVQDNDRESDFVVLIA